MDFVDYTLLVLSTMHDDYAVDMPTYGDMECQCANYIAEAFNKNVAVHDAAFIMACMIQRGAASIINPDKECPL